MWHRQRQCHQLQSENLANCKKGDIKDATSLENMAYAIKLISYGNKLRTTDKNFTGRSPLKVSHALMAVSQAQTNKTAKIWNDNKELKHSSLYNVGENIACGYFGGYPGSVYSDRWDWSAFYGWYDEEKEMYEMGYDAAVKKYGYYMDGHYLNIIMASYTTTGLSFSGPTPSVTGQVFSSGNYYAKTSYTAEEYQAIFNKYYAYVNPENAKKDLDNAKKTLTAKQSELTPLKNALTKAKNAQAKAQSVVDDLKNTSKLKNVETNLNKAKSEKASLTNSLNKAENERKTLVKDISGNDSQITVLGRSINSTNSSIADKSKLKETLEKNLSNATKARKDKEKELNTYNQNVKDLNSTKSTLTSLKKQLTTAKSNLKTAETDVTNKQKTYNNTPSAPDFKTTVKKYPAKLTGDYSYLNSYITNMMNSKVGWKNENGKFRYYSESDGKYYTGWHYMSTKEGEKIPHWSYFGSDGYIYTGWKNMGRKEGERLEHYSYFGPNGWLRTGWQKMGTKENPDGNNPEHWSYFGTDGWLRTRMQRMGDKENPDGNNPEHWSFFGSNGWLYVNRVFTLKEVTYTADGRGWVTQQ